MGQKMSVLQKFANSLSNTFRLAAGWQSQDEVTESSKFGSADDGTITALPAGLFRATDKLRWKEVYDNALSIIPI